MNCNNQTQPVQTQRRRFLTLLGAAGLAILALPVIRNRRARVPVSLREAEYYRSRDPAG